MIERAADRARSAVDQGGRELSAHSVDARHPELRRFAKQLGVFYFRRDVGLGLLADVRSRLDQSSHVVCGPVVAVGLGLDARQSFDCLAGPVTLEAQLGALLALGGSFLLGRLDLSGQRGRRDPGGCGGLLLADCLLRQGSERLEPTRLRDVPLSIGAQFGGGGLRRGPADLGRCGPGPALGPASISQRAGGTLCFLKRWRHLGAPEGRAEFSSQFLDAGGVPGELVTGAQRVGTAALAVGEALRVALAVLGVVELRAVGTDLDGARSGLGGGGLGELGRPLSVRQGLG